MDSEAILRSGWFNFRKKLEADRLRVVDRLHGELHRSKIQLWMESELLSECLNMVCHCPSSQRTPALH